MHACPHVLPPCRTIAHGKKLSKTKLMGLSVQEICDSILNPDVPHSLRLQVRLLTLVCMLLPCAPAALWTWTKHMCVSWHALQGILIGGVVVVFSKQQSYLLEDASEMMVGGQCLTHHVADSALQDALQPKLRSCRTVNPLTMPA